MIRSQQVRERWRKQRLDGKSVETMFQNRLIEEARCSPIVARAIWGKVHETLVGTDETGEEAARVGQLIFLAVAVDDLPAYGNGWKTRSSFSSSWTW